MAKDPSIEVTPVTVALVDDETRDKNMKSAIGVKETDKKSASVNELSPVTAVIHSGTDNFEDVKLANNMASDTALPYDDQHRTHCMLNYNEEDCDVTSHNTPMMQALAPLSNIEVCARSGGRPVSS